MEMLIREEKLNSILAHDARVQAYLAARRTKIEQRARAVLAAHRDEGHAFIEAGKINSVDHFVALNDSRGEWKAISIEYGVKYKDSDGNERTTDGVHALTNRDGSVYY